MMATSENKDVRFELPRYVKNTSDELDGAEVSVTYDSNFGGAVTVDGTAGIDEGRWAGEWTTLNVDGRKVRSNGHVFSKNDRHLGTVESITVTLPHDVAVDLVTDDFGSDYDVDRHDEQTVIQAWDKGVIEQEGFMAGTTSITLKHV